MVFVQGLPVLAGAVNAPISTETPAPGTVYACDVLTVATVRQALEAGVIGFITKGGNFASHAANLLRNARRRGRGVVWVRGVDVGRERWVEVAEDGTCAFEGDTAEVVMTSIGRGGDRFGYLAGRTRWDAVCIWPDRAYAAEEFALVRDGLSVGASELAGAAVEVTRRDDRVWFGAPALTSSELLDFALAPETSLPYLQRMVREYAVLMGRLRAGERSDDLTATFVTTLLPFHKSYPQVIDHIASRFGDRASQITDAALTNGVVRWLDRTPEFRSTRKVLGDPAWRGRLPDGSPSEYITETVGDLETAAPGSDSFAREWLATVVIVKELKMIIAKNIYAMALSEREVL